MINQSSIVYAKLAIGSMDFSRIVDCASVYAKSATTNEGFYII